MRVGHQFVVVHGALAGYELFVDWVVAVGGVDGAGTSEMMSGMVLFDIGRGLMHGKGREGNGRAYAVLQGVDGRYVLVPQVSPSCIIVSPPGVQLHAVEPWSPCLYVVSLDTSCWPWISLTLCYRR